MATTSQARDRASIAAVIGVAALGLLLSFSEFSVLAATTVAG